MESKKRSKTKKRICLISTDWAQNEYRKINNKPGAISQYRLINPKKYLSKKYEVDYWGSDFTKEAEGKDSAQFYKDFFSKYDLVISKITDNAQAASCIRFITQYLGIPLIVDIDDNIWELKEDQPGYKHYHKGSQALGIASTYVSMADAVFSSTDPLAGYIRDRLKAVYKEEKDVYTLPNCIDADDFNFKKAKLDKDKLVIGWQGSTTHHEDLKVAMPAIARLMNEYPKLYLELLGGVSNDMVTDLFKDMDEKVLDRVKTKPGVPAWDTFPHLLSEQAWDIAIAPLTDDVFNHAKSHIKWMEYAMYEIPCVASKVYPYHMEIQGTEIIEDGKTGVIANADEWYEKLKYLLENPQERVKIGKQAKKYVIENWQIESHGHKWEEAIEKVLNKS